MSTVVKLATDDPLFALCPELNLHRDENGELVANSRDVAKYFGRRHRHLMRHIMQKIWRMPMRPEWASSFRPRDNSFDLTADGLVLIVSTRWGKRGSDCFRLDPLDVCREQEARASSSRHMGRARHQGRRPSLLYS
jgi:hypothetical protein